MDSNRTILIVDDEPMFHEIGALFLRRCGRVLQASSGVEGISIAQLETPDVVLVDLHMPGLDGEAVCRAIKTDPSLPHTSVIMMLGGGDAAERARSLRAGADDVIPKPLSRITLLDAVMRHLRSAPNSGLPRIDLDMPVTLQQDSDHLTGTARNLSRGGIYVETDRSLAPATEVSVCFVLPQTTQAVRSTAQVIWRNPNDTSPSGIGLGMRFLEIDGATVQQLDDYIFERAQDRPAQFTGDWS